jgi:Na+-translocating ferredoxin:NAD+ oxidoreductase subunit B
MTVILTVILAGAVLLVLAIGMSFVLGWANRAFHVEVDPRVAKIDAALPGANCGGCGYVGCSEYAEAVADGKADVTLCAPGGSSCAQDLAEIMGVSVSEAAPYRAVVHCAATKQQRLLRGDYHGEPTCAAANLVAGVQGCTYGCLGFGDCERSCDYDAIDVVDGVAVVDQEKCIGCKACVSACPRNIISMIPFKADRMLVLTCANKDRGKDVSAVCAIGCIGCKACTKIAPDYMKMEGNRAVVDYDVFDPSQFKHEELQQLNEKCPMERFAYAGRQPTVAELAELEGVDAPELAEADFKTTVDQTEWRG